MRFCLSERRTVLRRACSAGLVSGVMVAVGAVAPAVAGPPPSGLCSSSLAPLQNLAHCNLNRAVLGTSLALANSDLVRANLNDSTISGQAALLGSDLAGANLHGAIVSGLDALINAVLNGANLDHARITASAVGVGADLTGVNLNAASITGLGDLSGANVTGTNLHDATISGTGALTGANLTRAHLEEATIAGLTALFGANLTGANLRGASITGTNALEGAVYSHTICPDGTNSDADGGTCAANLTPGADRHVSPRPHASLLRGANAAIAPALVSHGVVVTGGGCNTPGSPAQLAFQYLEPPSSAGGGQLVPGFGGDRGLQWLPGDRGQLDPGKPRPRPVLGWVGLQRQPGH